MSGAQFKPSTFKAMSTVGDTEWLYNEASSDIEEPNKQGSGAARAGCRLLERTDPDGKAHGSIPSHPDPSWTEEDMAEVAEDLRKHRDPKGRARRAWRGP